MDLAEKIKSIILETNESDLSEEETLAVINKILGLGEWEEVRDGLFTILYGNDKTLWNEAILYIFYFQNRGYAFEEVKTIALLYDCLSLSESLDQNLIWTITKNIKSLPYLSGYDPYHDSPVFEEMDKIEKMRKKQIH
jgi:hypothetical protein